MHDARHALAVVAPGRASHLPSAGLAQAVTTTRKARGGETTRCRVGARFVRGRQRVVQIVRQPL